MTKEYFENRNFIDIPNSNQPLKKGEYYGCTFKNCVFTNADLSNIIFSDCKFENCDLTMAKISNSTFLEVHFSSCKLLGLHFDDCNKVLLSMNFDDCVLNLSSFYKLRLKNTKFKNCNLQEVDFSEADLTNSVFSNCNFTGTIFDNTILVNCDFRTSFNFAINPEKNRIKKAKFLKSELEGLLYQYGIVVE